MKTTVRLDDYVKELLKKRAQEEKKEDIFNQFNEENGLGITSPTTLTTTEETRLLMEYMDKANMLNIVNRDRKRGKPLTLRKFFKSKRNQQVEVYSKFGEKALYTQGKVSAVGRDFVMLTNLKDRIWIPYDSIESANIPFGVPNYSNSHQHYIYDNDLRNKLLTNFGEVVSKREILKQQFYEESLRTNLNSWKNTWIEIRMNNNKKRMGRIDKLEDSYIILSFLGKKESIAINTVQYIQTVRIFSIVKNAIFIKSAKS
ncbi:hypothetical protein [Gracilibacillus xinjiangensis]|uniref:Uncharacterized protein n=1 Tax=Gracilibacillus xinjiangensis TaxID=1193282 RepID=A0ABV8WUW5_9BACI